MPYSIYNFLKLKKYHFINNSNHKNLDFYNSNYNKKKLLNNISNYNAEKYNIDIGIYPNLIHILKILFKKNFSILDIGAGQAQLYKYLNSNFKEFKYYYSDTTDMEKFINLRNNIVNNNFTIFNFEENIDFTYFGSSFQYLKENDNRINHIKKNSKYIFFSGLPLYENKKNIEIKKVIQINLKDSYSCNIHNLNEFKNIFSNFKIIFITENRMLEKVNSYGVGEDIYFFDIMFEKKLS